MKTNHHHVSRFAPAYPNEAEPGYFARKLLDAVTSTITGMGVLAIFFFLITL